MDYRKILEYRGARNSHANLLGIRLTELSLGHAAAVKTVTEQDLNPLGYVHGGVCFSLADTVCGTAMASYGYAAVTLNASYQFLRPASVGDQITAVADEVKHGKTVSVYEVRLTDQEDRLLGTGTFTFYQLNRKLEL